MITKIVTKTINNTTELNKLKERIEELERQNAELLEKNSALSAQLALRGVDAHKIGEQAQRIVSLEHELAAERASITSIQEQLDDALDAREKDRYFNSPLHLFHISLC